MTKVLQIASVKSSIRERDLNEELEYDQVDSDQKKMKNFGDEKVFGKDKDVAQLDPFFVEAADVVQNGLEP